MEVSKPNFPKIRRGKWRVVDRGYHIQVCLTIGGTFPFIGKLYCGYTYNFDDIQSGIDEAVREYEKSLTMSERLGVRVERR